MSRPKIVLYKAKTLKDGTHPVRLRLYFGKARYISLGYSCKENCWNAKANRFNKHTPKHREKNASLRKQELRAEKILSEMAATEKPFSFQEFKRRFNQDDHNPTVIEFIEKLMAEMQQNGSIGKSRYVPTSIHIEGSTIVQPSKGTAKVSGTKKAGAIG